MVAGAVNTNNASFGCSKGAWTSRWGAVNAAVASRIAAKSLSKCDGRSQHPQTVMADGKEFRTIVANLISMAAQLELDLTLMDIQMPGKDSI